MWLFLPVSLVLLYWWDSTTINRVLVSFANWATTQTPRRPPALSSDRLTSLCCQIERHRKRKWEKQKKKSCKQSFFQSSGREARSGLRILTPEQTCQISKDNLPGLNSQLDAAVNGRLRGQVCLSSSCSPGDVVTADGSCADIKTSSSAQED